MGIIRNNTTTIDRVSFPEETEGVQVHCNVARRDGKFLAIEFQTVTFGGNPILATFTMDEYGLHTGYTGPERDELLGVLKGFEKILDDVYGMEWQIKETEEE